MQLRPSGMLDGGRPWDQMTGAVTGCGAGRRLTGREFNRRTRTTVSKMGVGNVGGSGDGDGDATGESAV